MRVDISTHPDVRQRNILDIEEEIFDSCIEKGVLVARGSWFRTEPNGPHADKNTIFFRATFASATAVNIDEAIRRFGAAVKKSFRMA